MWAQSANWCDKQPQITYSVNHGYQSVAPAFPSSIITQGCLPPSQQISLNKICSFPDSMLFQDHEQINPLSKTEIEKLIPLLWRLATWELLPNVFQWVLRMTEKGFLLTFIFLDSIACSPLSWNKQELLSLLVKGPLNIVPLSVRESGGFESNFRYLGSEP